MVEDIRVAGGTVPGEHQGAMSVEMHRCLVGVQVVEHRLKRLPAVQLLGRLPGLAVHVHQETRVGSEQRHLALRVPAVRTMCVRVEQSPDREPVSSFLSRNRRVDSRGHGLQPFCDWIFAMPWPGSGTTWSAAVTGYWSGAIGSCASNLTRGRVTFGHTIRVIRAMSACMQMNRPPVKKINVNVDNWS